MFLALFPMRDMAAYYDRTHLLVIYFIQGLVLSGEHFAALR